MKEIIKYFDKDGNKRNREDNDVYKIVKQTVNEDRLVKEEIFFRNDN